MRWWDGLDVGAVLCIPNLIVLGCPVFNQIGTSWLLSVRGGMGGWGVCLFGWLW